MLVNGEFRFVPAVYPDDDSPTLHFASFANASFRGFIDCRADGVVRLNRLPADVDVAAPWPVRRVPLHCTPHRIVFHEATLTFTVMASSPAVEEDGTRSGDEAYEVLVVNARTWAIDYRFPLDKNEVGLCMDYVLLMNPEDRRQSLTLLAVGTGFLLGEDELCTGRIVVFDLVRKEDLTFKIEKLYHKDQKSPVSALAGLDGNLLLAIGPRLILHCWKRSTLVGLSFFDARFYIQCLKVVKGIVIITDVFHGAQVFYWQPRRKRMVLLGRDTGTLATEAAEFILDGASVGFVVSDIRRNLQMLTYAPEEPLSQGGKVLLPRAEAHTGAGVNDMARVRLGLTRSPSDATRAANRHAVVFGTVAGAVAAVVPLGSEVFERLGFLAKAMVGRLVQPAALNPRAHRAFAQQDKSRNVYHQAFARAKTGKTMLDGDLLWRFVDLAAEEQRELADLARSTPSAIIDALRNIEYGFADIF